MQGKENCSWFEYCTHRGLRCEWLEIQSNQVGTLIPKPTRKSLILTNPRSPSPVSTVQDFRLFNHFIQTAFPHYPVDNDSIWKHEIPSIASDVSYPTQLPCLPANHYSMTFSCMQCLPFPRQISPALQATRSSPLLP
jgi:hypothetical protein